MSIRIRQYANRKTYQASVRVNGRRLCKHFDRKVDAEKWERSQLESRDLGSLGVMIHRTLEDFSSEWLTVQSTRIRPATLTLTKYLLRAFILPPLGRIRMSKISQRDVNALVSDLITSGKSARYGNMVIALVRKSFNDAIKDWGFAIQNPSAKIKKLKERPRKLEFWTQEEVKDFFNTVRNDYSSYLPIFVFLLNVGCRIGEAFALHWSDVDLEKRMICIRRTIDRISHSVQESTKGNKIRYVGLNDAIYEALHELHTNRESKSREALVFPNKTGGIIHHSDFQRRVFDPAIKKAKVRKIRVHDLRHTFAAHFVMNRGSIYDLKQILGHSDIQMTERYAHLAPNYLQGRTAILNFR